MVFKLIRTDATDPCKVPLPVGTHVFGRGTFTSSFIECDDKRVSRTHGQLEVTVDSVILTSLHQNPCFYKKKTTKLTRVLRHKESVNLFNGDCFGALPHAYWYELIHFTSDNDLDDEQIDQQENVLTDNVMIKQEASTSKSIVKNSEDTQNFAVCDDNHDSPSLLTDTPNKTIVEDNNATEGTDSVPITRALNQSLSPTLSGGLDGSEIPTTLNVEEDVKPGTSGAPDKRIDHAKVVPASVAVKRCHSPAPSSGLGDSEIPTKVKIKEEVVDEDVKPVTKNVDQNGANNQDKGDSNASKNQPSSSAVGAAAASPANAPNNPPPRERCIYGATCYRRNAEHKAQLSHPNDADWGPGERGVCPYGAQCRRRDPRHWVAHQHPAGTQPPLPPHDNEVSDEDDTFTCISNDEAKTEPEEIEMVQDTESAITSQDMEVIEINRIVSGIEAKHTKIKREKFVDGRKEIAGQISEICLDPVIVIDHDNPTTTKTIKVSTVQMDSEVIEIEDEDCTFIKPTWNGLIDPDVIDITSETPSVSTASSTKDPMNRNAVHWIQVWIEENNEISGPEYVKLKRGSNIGDLRQCAQACLGYPAKYQQFWIINRKPYTDDNVLIETITGSNINVPFFVLIQKPEPAGALYEELVRIEREPLVLVAESFECEVCLCECGPGEGVALRECAHQYCAPCLRECLEHAEPGAAPCPRVGCSAGLQPREVRALLPPDVHDRWLTRALAMAESACVQAAHCRTPDCKGWAECEPGVQTFRCPLCRALTCIPCGARHEGRTCEAYRSAAAPEAARSEALLAKMVHEGKAMECPQCTAILTRESGCDAVLCAACRTELCWATRGRRWGPKGRGDISGGCRCMVNGKRCHPKCQNCH